MLKWFIDISSKFTHFEFDKLVIEQIPVDAVELSS